MISLRKTLLRSGPSRSVAYARAGDAPGRWVGVTGCCDHVEARRRGLPRLGEVERASPNPRRRPATWRAVVASAASIDGERSHERMAAAGTGRLSLRAASRDERWQAVLEAIRVRWSAFEFPALRSRCREGDLSLEPLCEGGRQADP